MNDSEIRDMIVGATRGPSGSFRTRLRGEIADALDGTTPVVARPVRGRGRPQRQGVWAGVVAAAAVAVGVVWFAQSSPSTVGPQTAPTAASTGTSIPVTTTPGIEPAELLASVLRGHRWVLVGTNPDAPLGPVYPYVDFDSASATSPAETLSAKGSDGCHLFTFNGRILDQHLHISEMTSSANTCQETSIAFDVDGDLLSLSTDGKQLTMRSNAVPEELHFNRVDTLGRQPTQTDLADSWQLGSGGPQLTLNPDGSAAIGACNLHWRLSGAELVVDGFPDSVPSQPYTCGSADTSNETLARLIDALLKSNHPTVQIFTTTTRSLWIVSDQDVFMLSGIPQDVVLHSRLDLSADHVVAGAELLGFLVVTNSSNQAVSISDNGCRPKWGVQLTNETVPLHPTFTGECTATPLIFPPGETRLSVSVRAVYPTCSQTPGQGTEVACVGTPPTEMPALPAGHYTATLVGGIPVVPAPAAVPIAVTAAG